jgi:hypothetical protein
LQRGYRLPFLLIATLALAGCARLLPMPTPTPTPRPTPTRAPIVWRDYEGDVALGTLRFRYPSSWKLGYREGDPDSPVLSEIDSEKNYLPNTIDFGIFGAWCGMTPTGECSEVLNCLVGQLMSDEVYTRIARKSTYVDGQQQGYIVESSRKYDYPGVLEAAYNCDVFLPQEEGMVLWVTYMGAGESMSDQQRDEFMEIVRSAEWEPYDLSDLPELADLDWETPTPCFGR